VTRASGVSWQVESGRIYHGLLPGYDHSHVDTPSLYGFVTLTERLMFQWSELLHGTNYLNL
jgi:hypothetical protein